MKTRIEPEDIRKGDLIRVEWPDESASEWRALGPEPYERSGTYYLIEGRPKPVVKLPTVPTLGWVTIAPVITPRLGTFSTGRVATHEAMEFSSRLDPIADIKSVTTFTPATPVSTELYEAVRHAHGTGKSLSKLRDAVEALLCDEKARA